MATSKSILAKWHERAVGKTPPARRCPIFPTHLLRSREMAPEGDVYVQTRYDHEANILTKLEKIVTKAGLVPWPKLMQNLRATRERELLAVYPAKDVTSWLGNSPDVANKHSTMTMQARLDRAITDGAVIEGVTRVTPSQARQSWGGLSKVPQTLLENRPLDADTKKADQGNLANNWVCLQLALADLPLSYPARTRTLND